jgi:hypothetical protein
MLNEFFYGKSSESGGTYSGAIAVAGVSGLYVYPFNSGTGFGTRYASPNTNPALGTTFNSDGSVIAVGDGVSPYVRAYKWTLATGFGTKYANPSSQPADSLNDVRFNPDDTAVVSAGLRSTDVTSLRGWTWDPVTGFGTKYADPSVKPGATTQEVAFSPDGNDVAICGNGNTDQQLRAYPFDSSTGYGTAYASPSTLLPANGNSVKFSPDGNAIVAACNGGLFAYPWVSGTGYGVQYPTPSTALGNAIALCFSPDGTEIAWTGSGITSFVSVHQWISGVGFGTEYAAPATPLPAQGQYCAFSPTGTEIAFAHRDPPYISVYRWIPGTGFGTKYADPSTLPTNTARTVAFYP